MVNRKGNKYLGELVKKIVDRKSSHQKKLLQMIIKSVSWACIPMHAVQSLGRYQKFYLTVDIRTGKNLF